MSIRERVFYSRAAAAAVGCVVACLLAGVALGQAADTPLDRAKALFGSNEWLVVSLATPAGPVALLPDQQAFFKLRDDGALAGTAGCNQVSSFVTVGPGVAISFGPAIATRMACPEPQMVQEFAIFGALEHFNQYTLAGGSIVLTGGGYQMALAARAPGGSVASPGDGARGASSASLDHAAAVTRYAASFNDAVAAAAAAGADWPSDPLRVALAFLVLRGAPDTTITRADEGAEAATSTVVTVVELGFLDDSVAGLEQALTLDLVDGVWRVSGYQGAWICHRSPGMKVSFPGVCP